MGRYGLFVDAGYLLAAGGWACAGSPRRSELVIDVPALVTMLKRRAAEVLPGKELLRLYWYDAAPNRAPLREQLEVASLDDTKIRIGQLTSRGDQKGVDAMLLSDLTTLCRQGSIADAIVVAGDGDFVEAVAQAQLHGTRVLLWGVHTPQSTVSPDLRREADRVHLLSPTEIGTCFEKAPPRAEPAAPTGGEPYRGDVADRMVGPVPPALHEDIRPVWASVDLDDVAASGRHFARQWAALASPGEVTAILAERPVVPAQVHYRLLRYTLDDANIAWGTRLSYDATDAMRGGFWEELARLAGEMASP